MANTYPSDVSGAKWYLAENKLSYPYVSSATKRIAYSAKATGIRLVNQPRVKE